jgi:sterol 24-C-methyltransferase
MTIKAPTPTQDPTADGFLVRLCKKNTDSKSHQETVDSYFSYWDVDQDQTGQEEMRVKGVKGRKEKSEELTNHYYDLVTDFYEYGKW